MADIENTQPSLEDEVAANRAIEQGLGVAFLKTAHHQSFGSEIFHCILRF